MPSGLYLLCGTRTLSYLPSENTTICSFAMVIRNLQVVREATLVHHEALTTKRSLPKDATLGSQERFPQEITDLLFMCTLCIPIPISGLIRLEKVVQKISP